MLFAGFFWGIKGLILRAESIILKIKHYTKDYYYRVRCASVAFVYFLFCYERELCSDCDFSFVYRRII